MRTKMLWLRSARGKELVAVEAHPTAVPGLLVHELLEEPDRYTVSHRSGFRIGGRFASPEAARAAVAEDAALRRIDWTRPAKTIHKDKNAEIAGRAFRLRHAKDDAKGN